LFLPGQQVATIAYRVQDVSGPVGLLAGQISCAIHLLILLPLVLLLLLPLLPLLLLLLLQVLVPWQLHARE
jgi:hypothetical protein